MLANRESNDQDGGAKRYLVTCESCPFERPADGRERATAIGTDHQRETRHVVVAFEVPPSLGSP